MGLSFSNGTVSASPGAQTIIQIVWPAQVFLTCADQLLEMSGALALFAGGDMEQRTVFVLTPVVSAGNAGRTMSVNGFAPVRVTQSTSGKNGLVTFPPNTLFTWQGGLAGPYVGLALQANGWQGFRV